MFVINKTNKIHVTNIVRNLSYKIKEFNHMSTLECFIFYPIQFTKIFTKTLLNDLFKNKN